MRNVGTNYPRYWRDYMETNQTHIPYNEFLKQVNLITLKDSHTIKKSLRRTIRESKKEIIQILKGIQDSPHVSKDVQKEIILSMYNGDSLEEKSQKISEKHNIPLEIVSSIIEGLDGSQYLKKKKILFEHEGKRPIGKWLSHPRDYHGLEDEKYGTAFQTTWIPELGLFFVVIDLDAHNKENDIPMDVLMDAIPKEFKDTRIINTPTNGKHMFYLSQKPLQRKDSGNINIDYKTIRKHNVEKTSNGYKTNGMGGYVVSSFRWSFDGETKEEYIWDEDSNPDILIVENVDDVLSQIYTNLHDGGFISDEDFRNVMELDLGDNVESIVDAIDITSKNTPQNEEDSFNPNNVLGDENKSLKYDDNGLLLLNNENGIQLLSNQVGEILKKTHGKHRGTLMGLDGGLERLGFSHEERVHILLSGLKYANDLTNEHKSQVKLSVGKDSSQRKKIGFPTILKETPNIEGEIRIIKNIRRVFWRNISEISFKLIEVPFLEILKNVSKLIQLDDSLHDLEDGKYDAFIQTHISRELDSFLEMLGVGLNERCSLLKQCFLKLNRNPSSLFEDYVSDKLSHGDEGYGRKRFGINLLPYKKTSFGKRVKNSLTIPEEMDDLAFMYVREIDDLCVNLDIQISHMELIGKGKPYIQPLINLVERPRGFPEYKRRQHASKYLKENDFLKKTKRHDYIFDSVETNSYIEVNPRSLGSFLSKKYPILRMGIEENELKTILSISHEFDELHNEYYIFNNGVLKLHERKFLETTDFHDYFTIKKMDCDIYFPQQPLELNPRMSPPVNLYDKTLREILIPGYKENSLNMDVGYYLDFMERCGSGFNTRIKDKHFVCYQGLGDNGKGILIEILKNVFGDRFLLVTMDVIRDDKLDLSDYDVLVIDELDEFSFDEAIAFIKRITGGDEDGTAQREHYTHDAYVPKNPSAFFLFTNKIPQVDLSDDAFYRRMDIIKLENKFLVNPNPTKSNEFREDSDLKEKLQSEKDEGVEWLVNASLQSYYQRHDENGMFLGFSKGQSSEQTKMIVSNTNPLVKFLMEEYMEDKTKENLIKNSTICENYKNYCMRNKIPFNSKGINANMGRGIRDVFGVDVKKEKRDGNYYFLKPKTNLEGLGDDDILYLINDEYDWEDLSHKFPSKEHNQYFGVYTRISELDKINTPPTKSQLKHEFYMYNIEGIISRMINVELIYQSTREEEIET